MSAQASKTFRIGDLLQTSVYAQGSESGPLLLLAAGQRIETTAQLHKLKEAGFAVDFSSARRIRITTGARNRTSGSAAVRAQDEFQNRLQSAQRVRRQVIQATADLMARLIAGHQPDTAALLSVSADLAANVAAEPYAAVALTHLIRCDDYTIGHSVNVAILSAATGGILGRSSKELQVLSLSGLMHDVGKHRLSALDFGRPDQLTPPELDEYRKHARYGFETISACDGCPEEVARVALEHHERLDGSGFPRGMRGDELHPYSRLVAVTNAFDNLTAPQPNGEGLSAWQALRDLHTCFEGQFDNTALATLTKLVGVFPVGTYLMLSTGESGEVIAPNPDNGSVPIVRVDRDRHGYALPYPFLLDLRERSHQVIGVQA